VLRIQRIQRIRQPSRRHYQQSMLHYHLKLFLVECFANVFYYKKRWKNKKTLKNVKKRDKNKKRKKVFLHLWVKIYRLPVIRQQIHNKSK